MKAFLNRTDSGPGGDGLDLDAGPQRQGGDSKICSAYSQLTGEVAGVDLVDGGEVGDVGKQDRGLDDVVVPEPGLGQDGAHVLEDLLGLSLDVALDGGALDGSARSPATWSDTRESAYRGDGSLRENSTMSTLSPVSRSMSS